MCKLLFQPFIPWLIHVVSQVLGRRKKKKPHLHPIFIKSKFWRKNNKKTEQEFMLKENTTKKNMLVEHFSQPTGKEKIWCQLIPTLCISF